MAYDNKQFCKEYYKNNKDYFKKWRENNREKCRKARIKHYWKHREEELSRMKSYQDRFKDEIKLKRTLNKKHLAKLSKEYIKNLREKNPQKYRLYNKTNGASARYPGTIKLSIVQMVYEDSIKKWGTLTCYLCEEPIDFGMDSLDHKIPASRGGTNDYSNLGVVHLKCNRMKINKTVEEYLNA